MKLHNHLLLKVVREYRIFFVLYTENSEFLFSGVAKWHPTTCLHEPVSDI